MIPVKLEKSFSQYIFLKLRIPVNNMQEWQRKKLMEQQ